MKFEQIIHSNPEIMGGKPVFVGTRVPLESFTLYLKSGGSLEEFLVDFPSVSREQVMALLDLTAQTMGARATAA